jgi:hypothetical protein
MELSMSYNVTIAREAPFLHAVVTGLNTRDNVARYLADIMKECAARRSTRLLIEERLEGPRMDTMDVFQLTADGSSRAVGHFDRIAYVDVNAEGDLMKFAETVAVNRGLPVRVFSSLGDAEQWLQELATGDTEPPASGPRATNQ